MLEFLRFTLTGLILLLAAPALAVPIFISEAGAGGGTTSASGSGSVSGALVSGSAQAAAGFLEFGGQASSTLTNANSLGAVRASATSLMTDTITITSPGIANGSDGFLQFVLAVDGTLNVTNTTDTFVTASVQVTITHDYGALGGWQ